LSFLFQDKYISEKFETAG